MSVDSPAKSPDGFQPNVPRVVEILQSLIRIPSVNPDGAPGSPQSGEDRIARWIGDFLRGIGARVEFEEVLPDRPNVFGHFGRSKSGKPRVLLAPHTDTVGVENMSIDPFGAEIRDGRIHGRGASDTKGTIAAFLAALEEIGADRLAELGADVTFVGLIGEETGQHGSRHLATHHRGEYAFAMVGEPTECAVVHAHKGCQWITLETRGRACHGSTPDRGRSAIDAMLPVLVSLQRDLRVRLEAREWVHPLLGAPTVNVGTIRGGTRPNIVPDRCAIELDIRATPALHRHGVEALLGEWLEAAGLAGSVTVTSLPASAPLDTPADDPFVRRLAELGAPLVGAPWLCDAAWLSNEGGIAAVAVGPGNIAQAHTADEFIEIEALVAGARFYTRWLSSL
jgi:acetylornithine deacetylase/succinyl-diaminopimelate desuccinylase-like protein